MKATITKIADHPGYGAALAKRNELTAARVALVKEEGATEEAIRTAASAGELLSREAAILLGEAGDLGPDPRDLQAKLTETRHKIAVHDEAIAMANRRLADATSEASAALCEAVGPGWKKLTAEIRGRCLELVDLVGQERATRAGIRDQGGSIRPPLSDQAGGGDGLTWQLTHLVEEIDSLK